jgi:nitrate/nitrite transporter NarK
MGAGAALAAPLVTALLLWFGWRMAFVLVATVGLAWAIGWWIWYRDDPAQHAAVNAAELRIIGRFEEPPTGESMAWRALLTNPGMLAIVLMYFTYGYTGYIYITWFPTYLIEGRHLSPAWAGALAALPTALGVVAKPVGGLWSDKLVARRGLKWGRRVVGMFGFGLGAVAALPGILTPNAYMSAILLSCADGGAAIAHSVCFAVCLDVARNRAGTVAALMLTAGSIGNALSALAFGALLQWTGSWVPPFLIAVAANFAGALLWLRIDPEKPVI